MVVLLAQMYGTITGNSDNTDRIVEKVQRLPAAVDGLNQLKGAVGDLQDQVQGIPTSPPVRPVVIQGAAGQPGAPGQAGKPGEAKVVQTEKTVVVTTPAPQARPTAGPTCRPNIAQLELCLGR